MSLPELGNNLAATFALQAERCGDRPLLHARQEGRWVAMSWREVAADVAALANHLAQAGIGPGRKVALIAENRPEWAISDLAILRAGGITVPSYTTYTAEDYAFVLEHSEAELVILGSASLARRFAPALAAVPRVRQVILMEPTELAPMTAEMVGFADALARGRALPDATAGLAADPDETACFIFTSGTGGRPKAAMLSHRNIMANIKGAWDLLEACAPTDRAFLSFLPLSHAYEHTVGQFLPIAVSGEIWYAEGVEQLMSNLAEVRPQILPCVPRLFEVFRQRTIAAVERQGGIKARLFWRAVELGTRRYHARGRLPAHLRPLDWLLDRLVRRRLVDRFGGRLAAMVCGGGPLNPEIGIFFTALGIPVCHGYGQTETSPVVSVTPPWSWKLHTVGPPLQGVEVRIAEDGEILVRGDLVMKGYWKDPEATASAIRDGWLHTGDVGELDAEGYLRITDRKKDIIVLSGGDNVAPQRIEAQLLMEPEIGQVVVYGDRRAYLAALVVPRAELLRELGLHGEGAGEPIDVARNPALVERVERAVKRVNARLAGVERIRRVALRTTPFTVENGLMTPTMKLRRAQIYREHAELLEGLYAARERATEPA